MTSPISSLAELRLAVDADAPPAATQLELRAGLANDRMLRAQRATEQLDALIGGAADRQLGAGDLRVAVLGDSVGALVQLAQQCFHASPVDERRHDVQRERENSANVTGMEVQPDLQPAAQRMSRRMRRSTACRRHSSTMSCCRFAASMPFCARQPLGDEIDDGLLIRVAHRRSRAAHEERLVAAEQLRIDTAAQRRALDAARDCDADFRRALRDSVRDCLSSSNSSANSSARLPPSRFFEISTGMLR